MFKLTSHCLFILYIPTSENKMNIYKNNITTKLTHALRKFFGVLKFNFHIKPFHVIVLDWLMENVKVKGRNTIDCVVSHQNHNKKCTTSTCLNYRTPR